MSRLAARAIDADTEATLDPNVAAFGPTQ